MIADKEGDNNGPEADNHFPSLNLGNRHRSPRICPASASQSPPFSMEPKTLFSSPAGNLIIFTFSSSHSTVSFTFWVCQNFLRKKKKKKSESDSISYETINLLLHFKLGSVCFARKYFPFCLIFLLFIYLFIFCLVCCVA